MKKTILLLAVLMPFLAGAQGQRFVDSLLGELQQATSDTQKIRLLDLISFTYSTINPDEGLKYAQRSLELSQVTGNKRGIAGAYSNFGINYEAKSDFQQALSHDRQAFDLYQELGQTRSAAGVLTNMALIYKGRSDYPHALELDFKAMRLYDSIRGHASKAILLENIGTIYQEQGNYVKAMDYYSAALGLQVQKKKATDVARILGNMGIIYDGEGKYEKALGYHLLALNVNHQSGNRNSEQINLANLGLVYCHLHNYARALDYQQQALAISESLGIQSAVAINLGNIGETYFFIANDPAIGNKNSLEKAIDYLERATDLCSRINFMGPLVEFDDYLSKAWAKAGDYKKAFDIFRKTISIRDTVYSQQNLVQQKRIESEHTLELKNKEIELENKRLEIEQLRAANKQEERALYLSGIVLLVLIAGFIIRMFVKRARAHKSAMSDIASIQSHEIRGPVARMLGLTQLLNYEDPSDIKNKELIRYIRDVSLELDDIVRKVVNKTAADGDGNPSSEKQDFHQFRG